MEMKIRESCLQSGTFIYKPGISVTKQDFHLQMGSLGLQMGFSGYYLPFRRRFTMNNTALGAVSNKKENIRFISEAHEKFYYEKLKEVLADE